MRKVVEKSTVAHLWANQIQDEARVPGGNFYFDGDTIYSYGRHFPIAVHCGNTILLTTRKYSNTTSSHVYEVRDAISHKNVINCYRPDEAKNGYHANNIEQWLKDIETEKKNIARARKPEIYIQKIERYVAEMQAYLDYFKIKLNKKQKEAIVVKDQAQYIQEAKARLEKQAKDQAAKMKLGAKVYAIYLDHWHNFTTDSYKPTDKERQAGDYYYQSITVDTWLRTDGIKVETSKGIKLPVDVARRYYDSYLNILANGGCNSNCGIKMQGYQVSSISKDGLIVGCHNIPTSEIQAIAKKLNWIN